MDVADKEQRRAAFREKAAAARALEDAARAKIAKRKPVPPPAPPPEKRRSGTEKRQRRKLIAFRVREEEYALYQEEASSFGVHLADLARVRMSGGDALRSVPRLPFERKLAAQLLGQLGKIGSNINQIARRANESGIVDVDEMRPALAVLTDMRAALFEILGRGL